jgi:hypothetical protein
MSGLDKRFTQRIYGVMIADSISIEYVTASSGRLAFKQNLNTQEVMMHDLGKAGNKDITRRVRTSTKPIITLRRYGVSNFIPTCDMRKQRSKL